MLGPFGVSKFTLLLVFAKKLYFDLKVKESIIPKLHKNPFTHKINPPILGFQYLCVIIKLVIVVRH
jgi:hypothetical protein